MPSYKDMYMTLTHAVTDAISALSAAQLEAERMYIEADDTPIHLSEPEKGED